MQKLSADEEKRIIGGEVLTLAIVLTYMAVALITVAVWKLYNSQKGKLTFPGGFLFEWSGS
jgi:hypothetical protein